MRGALHRTRLGSLTLHSYVAPEDGWGTASHAIELADRVVVIDAALLPSLAAEVATAWRALGKPIDRVLLTHAHPDHYAGTAAFGAPVHALAPTLTRLEQAGDAVLAATYRLIGAAEPVPARATDLHTVEPGTERIGGVTFEYTVVEHAEAAHQLVVHLPEHGVVATGDLVYAGVHPFLAERGFDAWHAGLDLIEGLGAEHVLAGHGVPGGPDLITQTREYLAVARDALASAAGADELAAALDAYRPGWGGRGMRAVQSYYLFPPAS